MKWGVVGGGIMGLALSRRLREAGHEVSLFESGPVLGGLARPWEHGSIQWDRYYHVILYSDLHTRRLLEDMGLESEARWVTTRTGFFFDGTLTSLSNAREYLGLPVLNLLERFRLGATIVYASRIHDWKRLESIPVETWLSRLSGSGTFRKLWRPLLRAKLGDRYPEVSAAFIWATIQRLYAARRSGLKREMLGYVEGGYQRVFSRFEERLKQAGVDLSVGDPVGEVEAATGHPGLSIQLASGRKEEFDRVVLTCNSAVAGKLCTGLSEPVRRGLEDIEYQGVVCASVLLKRPLADYYLTYLMDEDLPFTAVVEMSALVDRGQFNGNSLVYLPRYVHASHGFLSATDEEIKEVFLSGLERIYPGFSRDDVLSFQVSREKEVFALPTVGYSKRLPPVETNIPGLYIANSSQIVNGTLNVNETLCTAERLLPHLLSNSGEGSAEPVASTEMS